MLKVNEAKIKKQLSHMSKAEIKKMSERSDKNAQDMWDVIANAMK